MEYRKGSEGICGNYCISVVSSTSAVSITNRCCELHLSWLSLRIKECVFLHSSCDG